MPKTVRSVLVWLAFALAMAAPAQAWAQKVDVEKIKAQADEAMDNLRYADALDGYQKAYATSHDPRFLYNMGRALGALGQYPEAVEKLERFKMDAPADLRARVPQLDQLLGDFKRHVSTLSIKCNVPGARVLVRQKEVGTTPLADLRLNAGPATIEVVAADYVVQRKNVELPEGNRLDVSFELLTASSTGILIVRSDPAATSVRVDGRGFGGTPLETTLEAGPHRLLLARDGYRDLVTSALVERGGKRELDFHLEKSPSVFTRWWFWTVVSTVVVAAVGGTVAALVCANTTACERSPDVGTIAPNQVRAP
jgi:hypothetical protein